MILIIWIYGIIVFVQNTAYLIYSVSMLTKFKKTFLPFKEEIKKPLAEYPPISIVTSIRGTSMPLEEGLTCLMKQDYPGELELIIAIEDSRDPAYALANEVLAKVPHRMEVKWITDFKPVGGNPRTAKMAHAANFAKYDWLYWLATDTFSDPDHLRKMMHKTNLSQKTYVSSIPIQFGSDSVGAAFETIPLVWEIPMYALLLQKLKKPFVYGGSILFHKKLLESAGGFAPVMNYLTEEVPMSDNFTKVGGQSEIVPAFVWVRQDKQTLNGFYERKVRWAMIGRFHHRALFLLGFIYSAMWLALFWAVTGDFAFGYMLGIYLFVKTLVVYNYHTLLGLPRQQAKWAILIPVYEFVAFVYCVHAIFRKKVNWAGDIMRVDSSGLVTREV